MGRKELHEATRDCTLHLAKSVYKIQFKKRAPRAIREIKAFTEKEMLTKVMLNCTIHYQGRVFDYKS